jgi:hypothetical protein
MAEVLLKRFPFFISQRTQWAFLIVKGWSSDAVMLGWSEPVVKLGAADAIRVWRSLSYRIGWTFVRLVFTFPAVSTTLVSFGSLFLQISVDLCFSLVSSFLNKCEFFAQVFRQDALNNSRTLHP